MIVTDARVAQFVERAISRAIIPPFTCIGVERGGEVVAGVVFNCYTGADIHVTVAGSPTRSLIRSVGKYAYGQLRCQRMTVITEQPKVVEYAQRLGGVVEGALRNQFGAGRNGVLIGILRDEWKPT